MPSLIDWTHIDVTQLDPAFYASAQGCLNACLAHGQTYRPYFGYRSPAVQEALYQKYLAGGPKAAPPAYSRHCMGKAIDVVALNSDGTQDWTPAAYGLLHDQAEVFGLGTGFSYSDFDHLSCDGR
jgi:LAS superfamily LD-carboxypeptidase LdcB